MLEISDRRYNRITHAFFALMTIFAIVFANERFQADGAYYLFKVVNFETFQVEHQRFILIASQALPLAGVKLGLPLNVIILLNSLNNVVFFYLVFRYCAYFLRDQTAGACVILFSQSSRCSPLPGAPRALSDGIAPMMPALHWAMTRSGLEMMNSGAPMTGSARPR